MKKISVLGSINTDFVFVSNELPKPSETIMGQSFAINYGGKGANVSVAASRLGAKVKLFAAIGDDIFSKDNIKNLKTQKVDISNVIKLNNCMGGAAGINVGSGTNFITVVSGANAKYDETLVEKNINKILDADVIITQLETSFKGVEKLINFCNLKNKTLVFNPSPIIPLQEDMLKKCGYIIVNEIEILQLPNFKDVNQILKEYNGKLILTNGSKGVYYYYNNKVKHINSLEVETVNTTGAGDTFLAGFSIAIAEGKSLEEAIKFANVCAGLKVTKEGTQLGMPKRQEVEEYLKSNC